MKPFAPPILLLGAGAIPVPISSAVAVPDELSSLPIQSQFAFHPVVLTHSSLLNSQHPYTS
jgi:hypothetical protein